MAYGWMAFVIILIYHFVCEYLNRRERSRLLDRLMARNFAEFEYYDKKFVPDVSEVKALRKEAKVERERIKAVDEVPTGFEKANDDAVEKFIKGYEEDWASDEVDHEAIKKLLDRQ
jgi:hypothetical protein